MIHDHDQDHTDCRGAPGWKQRLPGSVVAALFGLEGFRMLAAADAGDELELLVETIVGVVP